MPLLGYARGRGSSTGEGELHVPPRGKRSGLMPWEIYSSLCPQAQRICRFLPADPGEEIPGQGFMHPYTVERERVTGVEWNENGNPNPASTLRWYVDSSGRSSDQKQNAGAKL
eukprot:COSAG06_NODE_268_length_18811_cov_4.369549_10_plen_113_part_00